MTSAAEHPILSRDTLDRVAQELKRRTQAAALVGEEVARAVSCALAWLEAGLYGRCGVCTRDLTERQILAEPTDMVCEECKTVAKTVAKARGQGSTIQGTVPSGGSYHPGSASPSRR